MLFNSVSYLVFFPVVFAAYWLCPRALKRFWLLAASYFFYMSWLPVYGLLLLSLTAVNYLTGLLLDRFRSCARFILIAGLIVNLGTLCFYKYANFFVRSMADVLAYWFHRIPSWRGTPLDTVHLDVILPLGISFFVFEFIHYLCDVYKGDQPIRHPVDFALFAAFFRRRLPDPLSAIKTSSDS